jgi:purine-binding chemotaxis protein CheW
MSVTEITETRQYLTFKLGNEVFATDVAKVREVLDFTSITKIPRTPDFMSGVINLRGSVVPVVDLRLSFEMSKTEKTVNTCIVVVEMLVEGEPTVIGALADSVEEVIDLEPDQIQPPPRIGTQIRTEFIKGTGSEQINKALQQLEKVIQQNASAAEEMASTTEKLTGQSDQLVSALGFFRTGDSGHARPLSVQPENSLEKLQEAVGHGVTLAPPKTTAKSGVALRMRDVGDRIDKEFERF